MIETILLRANSLFRDNVNIVPIFNIGKLAKWEEGRGLTLNGNGGREGGVTYRGGEGLKESIGGDGSKFSGAGGIGKNFRWLSLEIFCEGNNLDKNTIQ